MEGEPEDSDDDVQGEHKTTVLWEKRIQQSIVVDLSEDESLRLSDLQASSLDFHFSKVESAGSEASVHLKESTELSTGDDKSSGSGVVSSEKLVSHKSGILQRHTMQDEETLHQEYEDPGQNTSDEDQEDLPYDEELGSLYFTHMVGSKSNVTSDGKQSTTGLQSSENVDKQATLSQEDARKHNDVAPTCICPPVDVNQLLLRHLAREEWLQTGRPIEAETLPEVSLLESVDDILCSPSAYNNTAALSNISERENSLSKSAHLEEANLDRTNLDYKVCDVHTQKVPHLHRSFSDLKYGQGQVHYPLPDFSKVAPKVKIPKGPSSGTARPVPSPMIKTQSSPGMLELISRVLEDSGRPSENPQHIHQLTGPTTMHHLQDEYDKLLTEYTEADNLRDKIRLGTNPSSDFCIENYEGDPGNLSEGSHVGPLAPRIPTLVQNQLITSDQGEASDAEKMAAELRDVISQFMQTVDDFKQRVSNRSVSREEQQMMLRSLMEAQDQLERKYMSKKEEHRALEMQNYLGLSRNIGTFDPNRVVEGDIFRVGMHLEDIKEMIDKVMCEQIIPPLLSSTPKAMTMKATSPSSLHEGSSAGLTTEFFKMETKTEAKKEASGDDGLFGERGELLSDDLTNSSNRLSVYFVEGHAEVKDEEEREAALSEGIGSSQQWTPGSGTQGGGLNPNPECDLVDGVSLVVEVSSSSDACSPLRSQGIVCRETDSGFGSSYLNQSSGTLQPSPPTERVHSDGLSTSDSEGSSLNLQTTIHPSNVNRCQGTSANSPVQADLVDLWVQSTTKDSVKLQGPDASNHYACEPILSTAMDREQKERQLCSCNSEAIQDLQAEVSKLKKDLEEGLVQLPQLAQKMDYLASKYRQERRYNSRPRTRHKPTRQRQTSQLRLDDWISTDMDPSKSKGTDSGDASCSQMMLHFHSPPVGGDRVNSISGQFQEKLQANVSDVITSGPMNSRLKEERHNNSKHRTQMATMEGWSVPLPLSTQRPLLQVGYASSCSLPASYKVREPPVHSVSHPRKHSTQSDTALLPSNVYFQQTLSPGSAFPRAGNFRTGSKEEKMNRPLDQALKAARDMKRKTDRMVKRLTADLVKAQLLPQESVQH
ncbi:uncharacterized protein LOC129176666 isoform X2 [Dunckerocampus dactyliophorus]|uniref:uncharacterized protein LOC129176666 isoform X2 n=1 Tax=Dunckerocampus dactyliophorus TaxID=161453 RepID=UPI0024054487|nr:uncharacterized protein LOC129176666 isoform X2 [Dunckerocampus dactyliophorus]